MEATKDARLSLLLLPTPMLGIAGGKGGNEAMEGSDDSNREPVPDPDNDDVEED